ncbi:T6SS effector amidase Tae4 family protein [Uliginosibacterium aquaticum]|uniref:Type VI secretion system (T6SS), amidase effector protein 4 n=1 Tax=Uliginosibacterium aquaticum TaxID=2731212 RepID=A0ABX2IJV8_9RHOO|nr:T6SS effector amidase Tae4 family protein [Uliginosibacterium aquaticum]NSL57089.1 hypothetical protein [Uliginosibacterium aquaticum]
MKPAYSRLKAAHFSSNYASPSYRSGEALYASVGYEQSELLKQNPAYINTCAVRMSLALLDSGVAFTGRLPIKTGKHKGKRIESGAKLLADQLALRSLLGKPQVFSDPGKAADELARRRGIVFFHRITGYGGGHIDLLEPSNLGVLCNSNCYFNCKEVWFWELA